MVCACQMYRPMYAKHQAHPLIHAEPSSMRNDYLFFRVLGLVSFHTHFIYLKRREGWTHDAITFLRSLKFEGLLDHAHMSTPELVDLYAALQQPMDYLLAGMAQGLCSAWSEEEVQGADPRVYAGEMGSSVCRYLNWMGPPDCSTRADGRPAALRQAGLAMARARQSCLMRFRICGCARARTDRVCLACGSAGRGRMVEVKKHLLLECPEFDELHSSFAHVLPFETRDMLSVMSTEHQKDLAVFITQLRDCFQRVHNTYVDAMACEVCNRQDNEQNMLLCDGECSRGFHMQFHVPLVPPVVIKPGRWDAWFCHLCSESRALFDG